MHTAKSSSFWTDRYHSAQALSLMNKYRIGRVELPWTNFTPPIRGGVYRARTADQDSETETDLGSDSDTNTENSEDSSPASWNSSNTSIENIEGEKVSPLGKSKLAAVETSDARLASLYLKPPVRRLQRQRRRFSMRDDFSVRVPDRPSELMSPDEYTSYVMHREIDKGVQSNPSLDQNTQRDIAMKHQRLHERIKREGFYECNYSEYGKELIRYAILFACFVGFLRAEWYMVSAAFLGLFWVSRPALYIVCV